MTKPTLAEQIEALNKKIQALKKQGPGAGMAVAANIVKLRELQARAAEEQS